MRKILPFLFLALVQLGCSRPAKTDDEPENPFDNIKTRTKDKFNDGNHWGFMEEPSSTSPRSPFAQASSETTAAPDDLPPDLEHNGALKDVGSIGVGYGVGVGVPGNDPVSVNAGVSVGLDGSGLAGGLPPFTRNIFPRQGEQQSLNDYDGNKDLIYPGKAAHYYRLVRLGWIRIPQYQKPKTLVNVAGNTGVGTGR